MARVCEEWYPKGSYKGQRGDGFYIDDILKQQMEILIKNVVKDWDFTIIVSGGGEVRVGKSVLAMQVGMYWTYLMWKHHGIKIPFNVEDNFVFRWEELIEKGHMLGNKAKYSALIYDEAGETLEGAKVLTSETKEVLNYLRECGQYNFLNILVMPEFFELPRRVALTRSKFLLDVYYGADAEGLFTRGYFKFFSQRQKKKLYLRGKKELNYHATPFNFKGRFYNMYPISEDRYRERKNEAFASRDTKKEKFKSQRDKLFHYLLRKKGEDVAELVKKLKQDYFISLTRQTITNVTNELDDELMRIKVELGREEEKLKEDSQKGEEDDDDERKTSDKKKLIANLTKEQEQKE